ncbi:hypothetical protein [Arsenicicoccus sp. oral taxon 190]|uniref:hypothetical protein n=1 Tax=Arsenicicoccus sp. oral taxon 190 TaxID=1658671 RepID=UPI00067A263E|nr:hypothetical protein [Arsenicicoccus sp. oral taxon 190]AKT51146.1 hypothetical protein ADJ73_07145 [Arsenicicoccus sp. oral taxon 190]
MRTFITRLATVVATAAATVTVGLAGAAPAHATDGSTYAAPGCPTRTTSPMLARFGDDREYFAVPNGGFSTLSAGWSGFHSFSPENEPWYVNPASWTTSLALFRGDSARTASLCVGEGEDSFRFFYKGTGMPGTRLTVKVTITSDTGTYVTSTVVDASPYGWRLSPSLRVPNYATDKIQTITIGFSNTSTGPSMLPVLVDDVLIDPWRSAGF